MAKYYRKRRYSRRSSDLESISGILALLFAGYGYTYGKQFIDDYPYAMPLALLALFLFILTLMSVWWRRRQRAKHIYDAFTVSDIDIMTGEDFERYLADLLKKRGFTNIQLTEKYDMGVDIIAQKDGITWGIQAKRYGDIVKAAAVRQVYTALTRYKCDRAMVITNSTFSRPAKLLASDTNCVLIDRQQLSEWAYEAVKANR
jgi:restriction system protein